MESLLSIKHLKKDLEDFQLKDINLELPVGKIMGLSCILEMFFIAYLNSNCFLYMSRENNLSFEKV